jgi:ornithine decarboxylase
LALSSTDNDPSALIYANPQRAEKDLEAALRRNVKTLTFDGAEELHKVHRIHQKLVDQHQHQLLVGDDANPPPPPPPSPPDMVLRILVPDKHSTVPLGEKFGVPPGQIEALAELAADLDLPIVGVSFHCGSGNHDPDAYRVAVELAHDASRTIEQVYARRGSLDHRCWLLDIGGGFPGRDGWGADLGRFVGATEPLTSESELLLMQADRDGETARKVAETVVPVLEQLYPSIAQENEGSASTSTSTLAAPIQFMAEPGRYFVEAAFALCSRIYRVKVEEVSDDDDGGSTNKRQHRHYYIGQGVQGLFKDCILCGESFLPVPYSIQPDREAKDSVPCTIHGPSGEEYDVVCRDYLLPPLEVDDWLIFDRMGAYTLSIAARSGRPAIRYVMGGSQLPLPQP